MANYTPPGNINVPTSDLDYAIQINWPVLIAAAVMNARYSMFGYLRWSNTNGHYLYNIVFNNKLNYIDLDFPTYFSHKNIHGIYKLMSQVCQSDQLGKIDQHGRNYQFFS